MAHVHTLYEQTGSISRVMWFVAGFVRRKAPDLLRRRLYKSKQAVRIIGRDSRNSGVTDGNPPLVAVRTTGAIGDHIVTARFMRDLSACAEDIRFDVYTGIPGPARWIFAGVKGFRGVQSDTQFDSIVNEYDVCLCLSHVAILREDCVNWPRLRHYPKLRAACDTIARYRPKIDSLIVNQPFLDDAIARLATFANTTRRDFLHKIAGVPYGGDCLEIATDSTALLRMGLMDRAYVTVGNGYESGYLPCSTGVATKCYPHFGPVLAQLKAAFPGLLAVQLGNSTTKPICGTDLNLINKTNLLEAAEILRHSQLHLDIDGGLVHLASCLSVPSCVIFGPTPSRYFGYPINLNIGPNFCGGCWWINSTWMDVCPRGFAAARCMSEQDPGSVARIVERYLREKMRADALGKSEDEVRLSENPR